MVRFIGILEIHHLTFNSGEGARCRIYLEAKVAWATGPAFSRALHIILANYIPAEVDISQYDNIIVYMSEELHL